MALTNIAAHKRVESVLCLTSQYLSLATRITGIGIWEWDIVQDTLIWDHQMFVLYGVSQGNFQGEYKNWKICIHPEDLQQTEEKIQLALREKKNFDTEFRVCRPDTRSAISCDGS